MAYGQVNADVIGTSVAGSNLGAGNASIMKNRIINGAMVIDQRNAGASVSTSSGASIYTLDRWQAQYSQTSKFTVQQSSTAPTGFVNSLKITSSSAYTVVTGDYFSIAQRIEGFNIADLGFGGSSAKTVTLSFWVQSSLTGTFGGALQNSGASRSYPFTYTISSANTWEQKTVTIAGDTSGTWLTTNGNGLTVNFGLGTGTQYSGTAGSWAATDYESATGATSVVGTNGATFYITGVQLEVGSSATGFEYRLYNQELAACQRYFQVIGDGNTYSNPFLGTATFDSTTGCFGIINFATVMRTSPTLVSTVTTYRANIGSTNGNSTTAPTLGSGTGNYNVRFDQSGYSGFTANTTGVFRIFSSGYFAVSAEL
jgi:hypothetical protein